LKRLLLVGGGHAHLQVLAELGRAGLAGWQVDLVSPHEHQLYSGMLPGWIAGHHALDACRVALRPLADDAGIRLHLTTATRLDASRQVVHCADGQVLPFDLLSLDVGPAPALHGIAVDSPDVLPIRPLDGLVDAWPRLMERIAAAQQPFDLVVAGAGAGGFELACSVQHRALREGWRHLRVTLLGSDALPLPGAQETARRRALRLLQQRGIRWCAGRRVQALREHELLFEAGAPLAFDACWLATGAAAPAWLRDSGLALDEDGFVRVTETLQAVGHPHVFAAGDVAALTSPRPKSGVYAVRAGPPLAHNLRAFTTGAPLQPWRPQAQALYLVSTGDRYALGLRGRWSWQGAWAWHWKSRIDRAFVGRYARPV
jgi:selenide,water dikinase